MSISFEQEYYESPAFWSGSMLEDDSNTTRILETIKLIPEDIESIVDVGCGNGKFLNRIKENKKKNIKLVGIDRSEEALKYLNTEKLISEINNLELNNSSFDCVTCLQVLEHLHYSSYANSLSELARVSKKYIIVSVPYKENLKKSFTECPNCLCNFNRELHLRSYNDETIEKLFSNYGFKMEKKINLINIKVFVGIHIYSLLRNLFSPKPSKTFESPICILCGYKNNNFSKELTYHQEFQKSKPKNLLKAFIKKYWPTKNVKGYWIIALYKKVDNKC